MSAVERAAVLGSLAVIRLYRLLIASWLPPVCRFEPSCSRYAEQALERYGLAGGLWRAAGRIVRCHPFHPGGLDPLT